MVWYRSRKLLDQILDGFSPDNEIWSSFKKTARTPTPPLALKAAALKGGSGVNASSQRA